MDIRPPKRVKNIDFKRTQKLSADIGRVKQVSSTLKPKTPKIITDSQINQKLKEQVISHVGEEKSPKHIKLGIFIISILFIFIASLYFVNIQNFPKFSNVEQVLLDQSRNLNSIARDVLYAPKNILDLILIKMSVSSVLASRIVSGVITLFSTILFFILIRQWLSFRITVLSTILFSSSTWVIFQARGTGYGSALLLLVPILLLSAMLIRQKKSGILSYLLAILLSLCFYVPGFLWLFLVGIGFYFKEIKVYFKSISKLNTSILLPLIFLPLIPLVYLLSRDIKVFMSWLGWPEGTNIRIISENLLDLPAQLILNGVDIPLLWPVNTPTIDAVTAILCLTGVFYIFNRERYKTLKKSSILFSIIILALIAINGFSYISLLLPLFYIFAAMGLAFLVEQWFHIFPRNPLARYIGLALVTFLVLLISSYHIVRYFVAWPRMDDTKQAYTSSQSVTIDIQNKE